MQRPRSRVLDWPFHWSRKEETGRGWRQMCFVEVWKKVIGKGAVIRTAHKSEGLTFIAAAT